MRIGIRLHDTAPGSLKDRLGFAREQGFCCAHVALSKVQSVVYLFYQYSFTNGNKGYGATIVMVLLVFIMVLTWILQQAEKKIVYHA